MTERWMLERSGALSGAAHGPHACFDYLAEDGSLCSPGSAVLFATREEANARRNAMPVPEEWVPIAIYGK